MGKVAFAFPGQGAQYPGMGRDFHESYASARNVLDSYENEYPGLLDMIFSSSADTLMKTENTQKALYAVETAIDAVLKDEGIIADAALGFSLGELSALASSGVASTVPSSERKLISLYSSRTTASLSGKRILKVSRQRESGDENQASLSG